ncbi:dihydrofolate reductase [Pieris napi]|uniref:dihydrofolate reductase n=1 Tax=Pieris napi TaxID=78633 RepID=UPI001FBAD1E1|nr:dihydrofolate reductase [Pieris napi]
MPKIKLNLIAAACENMGIGVNGTLPWRLKNEMAYFTKMTSVVQDNSRQNAVIMGRVTWDCIPPKYKPLSDRINIVLTRNVDEVKKGVPNGVEVVNNLDEAIKLIESRSDIEAAWVIGGSHIYKAAIEHPNCEKIYLTEIQKKYECDTFFPDFDRKQFQLVNEDGVVSDKHTENGIEYYTRVYKKCY